MRSKITIAFLSILAVIFLTAQTCTTGLAAECVSAGDIVCDETEAYECGYSGYGYYVSRAAEYDVEYCGAEETTTDSDEDGLTDYDEINTYYTDPNDRDSDDDGALDGEEVVVGDDPLDAEGGEVSSTSTFPTRTMSSSDSASDGLTDLEERAGGTDPNDVDSDDDYLSDYDEMMTYATDPNDADTDSDGYDDGLEVRAGADPLERGVVPAPRDQDGDFMPDFYETAFGLDPLDDTDATEDIDRDGLTNYEEYLSQTDPTVADTDGDTYSDYDEINVYSTNPRNAASYPLIMTAHPSLWIRAGAFVVTSATTDTDGDGMPDTWEETYGFNPDNAGTASGDYDGDGVTNLGEYEAGTDPTVAEGCGAVVLNIDDIGATYTDPALDKSVYIAVIMNDYGLSMTNELGVDGGHLDHTYLIDFNEGTRTSLDWFILDHLRGYSRVDATASKVVYDIGYDADDVTFDIEEDGDVVFTIGDAASMQIAAQIRENENYLSDFMLTMNNLDLHLVYEMQLGTFDTAIFQKKHGDETYAGGSVVGEITAGEDVSEIFSDFGDTTGPEYTMSAAIKIWETEEFTEISETLADHFVEQVLQLADTSGQGFSIADKGSLTLEEMSVSGDQVTLTLCDIS